MPSRNKRNDYRGYGQRREITPFTLHRYRSDVARGISSAEADVDGNIFGCLSVDQHQLADFIEAAFAGNAATSLVPDCGQLTTPDSFLDIEAIMFIGLCFRVAEIDEMDEGCYDLLINTRAFLDGERLPRRWVFHPMIKEVVFADQFATHGFVVDKKFGDFLQAYAKHDGDTAPPPPSSPWPATPTRPVGHGRSSVRSPSPLLLSPVAPSANREPSPAPSGDWEEEWKDWAAWDESWGPEPTNPPPGFSHSFAAVEPGQPRAGQVGFVPFSVPSAPPTQTPPASIDELVARSTKVRKVKRDGW